MPLKLPFGLRVADQRLVDVRSVPNGEKCGCVCPACKAALVAKNMGRIKVPHFAHTADCGNAYETAIHEAAKQIIRELGFVWLPASIVAAKKQFQFSGHTLEKRYDRVVPDVLVWMNPERALAIEMFVTHAVGEEKLQRLRSQRLACVEFDLSALSRDITYEDLRVMFATNALPSKWIFNQKIEIAERRAALERRRLEAEKKLRAKQLVATMRAGAIIKEVYATKNRGGYVIYHVPDCPWRVRAASGYSFANVHLDCEGCRFCFGIAREHRSAFRRRAKAAPLTVACSGHMPEARELVGKGDWKRPWGGSGFPDW